MFFPFLYILSQSPSLHKVHVRFLISSSSPSRYLPSTSNLSTTTTFPLILPFKPSPKASFLPQLFYGFLPKSSSTPPDLKIFTHTPLPSTLSIINIPHSHLLTWIISLHVSNLYPLFPHSAYFSMVPPTPAPIKSTVNIFPYLNSFFYPRLLDLRSRLTLHRGPWRRRNILRR